MHSVDFDLVLGILAILLEVKPRGQTKYWAAVLCFAGFWGVLAWWLTLDPSILRMTGNWQPDSARTARAEIDGDHNSQFTQLRLIARNRRGELLDRADIL
jgi:hypothetical protein